MKTLDLDQCASLLKVDATTAQRLAFAGKLPGAKIGRAWVFLEDDVIAYLRCAIATQVAKRVSDNAPVEKPSEEQPAKRRGRSKTANMDWTKYGLPDVTTSCLPNPIL